MASRPLAPGLLVGLALLAAAPVRAAPQDAARPDTPDAPKPQPGERLAPAYRVDAYHGAATEFLESLPETSRVRVERASGARFELELAGGVLTTRLPPSSLSEDGSTLTTPLGFRLSPAAGGALGMTITAPNGRFSEFTRRNRRVVMQEGDGNVWNSPRHAPAFRLPDATRIDLLEQTNVWEVLTLAGERFRYDALTRAWEPLGRIPSPPLIPDLQTAYLAGDGDDWRLPYPEDHTVFAWSWYPYGFTIQNVLEESWRGFRRADIEKLFEAIEIVPEPAELGGYLIARRLGLGGGDRLIIERPAEEPFTVYLLPGSIDPDFILPRLRDASLVFGNRDERQNQRKSK